MTLYKMALAVSAALILSACGGSGGGGSNNVPNTGSTEKPNQGQSSLNSVPKELQAAVKGAKDFAPYEDSDLTFIKLTIDGKTVRQDELIDFTSLKNGFSDKKVTLDYIDEKGRSGKSEATMKIYQQPYSMVIGTLITKGFENDSGANFSIEHVRGLATAENALPTEGKFTYNGVAFSGNDKGSLNYSVDFAARTGGGTISGLNQMGSVTLHEASIIRTIDDEIGNIGIAGKISASKLANEKGTYELGFFGPKAQEIAGDVWFDNMNIPDIGFAGTR